MSIWLCWLDNAKQNINLFKSLQRCCVDRLVHYARYLRKERNESNECIKPCESSKPCGCSTAITTNACASSSTTTRAAASRNASTNNGLIRKWKYVNITTSRDCNAIADSVEREYAEYIRSTKREVASARVRSSDEHGYIKQTNSDATNSINNSNRISTGVTV